MKVTYLVCAQVTEHKTKEGKTSKKLVNTYATLDIEETETYGSIAERLVKKIPNCDAVLNFWEYKYL